MRLESSKPGPSSLIYSAASKTKTSTNTSLLENSDPNHREFQAETVCFPSSKSHYHSLNTDILPIATDHPSPFVLYLTT